MVQTACESETVQGQNHRFENNRDIFFLKKKTSLGEVVLYLDT